MGPRFGELCTAVEYHNCLKNSHNLGPTSLAKPFRSAASERVLRGEEDAGGIHIHGRPVAGGVA